MKIQNITHKPKKDVIISVRITKDTHKWLKKKNINPQALFNEAVVELQGEMK